MGRHGQKLQPFPASERSTVSGKEGLKRKTLQLRDRAPLKIGFEMRHLDMCLLLSRMKNRGKDVISFDSSYQTSHLKILRYYSLELMDTLIKSENCQCALAAKDIIRIKLHRGMEFVTWPPCRMVSFSSGAKYQEQHLLHVSA